MNPDSPQSQPYLLELHRITKGDLNAKASMFEVGAAVGLDKTDSGKMAEELIALGWVEIKTLSGGIGITAEGIEAALAGGAAGPGGDSELSLGSGPILEKKGSQALEKVVAALKERLPSLCLAYDRLEEIVIDIKTLEVQLLSPRPKIEVIKQILRSLQTNLTTAEAADLNARLDRLIKT